MLRKILISIGKITGGICLGVAIAFLFGWLVMLLWNWLMPDLFGLPVISFWQAWGLVILSHILFKAGGHPFKENHHEPAWRSHFRKKVSEHLRGRETRQNLTRPECAGNHPQPEQPDSGL